MKKTTIGFIGGGNMARSLIGGLIADGVEPGQLLAADPDPQRREQLAEAFGIRVSADNAVLAAAAEVVVLAVKPQIVAAVCSELASELQARKPLVLSIAAGLRIEDLERWLGEGLAIVRTMPNTPSLVQSGATALSPNRHVTESQRELAEAIMRAVGLTLWLEGESQMDAVTAVSGSGPAYLFLVMEAMERAAVRLGLPEKQAHLLVMQTAFGATKMALESPEDMATLRARVTSPGGTTERAIAVLEEGGLPQLFEQALTAARDRSAELAKQLGEQGE